MLKVLVLTWLGLQSAGDPKPEQQLAIVENQAADLVKRQPSASNWQKLALARFLQNKYAGAIDAFQTALKRDPTLWTSHLFLGVAQYRTNQFPAALASLIRAERLAPQSAAGRDDLEYWLGATRIAQKQPIQGLQALERLLTRNPKHIEALQLATETYAEAAAGLWNRVAERAFQSRAGQEVHGHALESEGNREGAIDAFSRAIDIDPRHPGPGAAIGRLRIGAGDLGGAREALDRELQLDPTGADANFYAGLLSLREGKPAAAVGPLELAVVWMSANEEPAIALCQAYLAIGDPSKAQAAAGQAVAADEGSIAAHEMMLAALASTGDREGMEKERARWGARKR